MLQRKVIVLPEGVFYEYHKWDQNFLSRDVIILMKLIFDRHETKLLTNTRLT